MRRHLVLIGLPGSGKSTVGVLLAERLGTHCTDIDSILIRVTGLAVVEQFAAEGEATFREREHRAVLEALELPPHVIAPGGGWAARPGRIASLGDRAVAVHLAVEPGVAAARLGSGDDRPLVAGAVPERLAALARERAQWYRGAPVEIDVSARSADEVADLLVEVAKSRAGW